MAPSKKQKLIASLKKLEIKELSGLIRSIEKMDFSKEADLNATLTRLVFIKVLKAYPSILDKTMRQRSEALKEFCRSIEPIHTELSLRPSPKIRR